MWHLMSKLRPSSWKKQKKGCLKVKHVNKNKAQVTTLETWDDSLWCTRGNSPPRLAGPWRRELEVQRTRRPWWTGTCADRIAPLGLNSPVTDVPHGEPSMAPWLRACSSMQDCWPLRPKSTVMLKFPRSWPPWDTVVKESESTHFWSSAGSERAARATLHKVI